MMMMMMMRGCGLLQRVACKRAMAANKATALVMTTFFVTMIILSNQQQQLQVLAFQGLPIRRHTVQRRHQHQQRHNSFGHDGLLMWGMTGGNTSGKGDDQMIHLTVQKASSSGSSSLLQSSSIQKTRRFSLPSQLFFSLNNNNQDDDNYYDEIDDNDDSTSDGMTSAIVVDPLVKETSRQLKRISWLSWWSQVILSTISTTILIFAASVLRRGNTGMQVLAPSPPFLLSALSLILSATSVVWTWGNGTRLSRRLLRNNSNKSSSRNDKGSVASSSSASSSSSPSSRAVARMTAANLLRRAVRIQVTINLMGLLFTILAAEQIVGSLAIKVLTTFVGGGGGGGMMMMPYGSAAAGGAVGFVQPLDILVVQANTNTLLSHFVSLATSLFLTNQIRTLDPPKTATVK